MGEMGEDYILFLTHYPLPITRISHKQCDHNLYNPYRETVSGIFHGVDFLCNMETQNPVLIRV